MKPLADMLIEFQKTEDKVIFVPQRFENTLLQWMYNIQDWCISRQLWWGHRIPAWYRENENGEEEIYVGKTAPAGEGWHQDEDSLDTWFSSGLWPFSTLGWPEETGDLARYFEIAVYTENLTDLGVEIFHVISVALLSKAAKAIEVLANLGCGHVHEP